jgi:ElaA protein
MDFICRHFNELKPKELYEITWLRNEVFVVEQNCVYQDADHKDHKAFHLMGWMGDDLAAYTRLLPPGVSYEEISIGRVVTNPKHRRSGLGKELMTASIQKCYELFGFGPIKIGAQVYLTKFYNSFGFVQCSEVYLEDGIEHISMIKQP